MIYFISLAARLAAEKQSTQDRFGRLIGTNDVVYAVWSDL